MAYGSCLSDSVGAVHLARGSAVCRESRLDFQFPHEGTRLYVFEILYKDRTIIHSPGDVVACWFALSFLLVRSSKRRRRSSDVTRDGLRSSLPFWLGSCSVSLPLLVLVL